MAKIFDITFSGGATTIGAGIPVTGASLNTNGGTFSDESSIWQINSSNLLTTAGGDFQHDHLVFSGLNDATAQTIVMFTGSNYNAGTYALANRYQAAGSLGSGSGAASYSLTIGGGAYTLYQLPALKVIAAGSMPSVTTGHQCAIAMGTRAIPGYESSLAQEISFAVIDLTTNAVVFNETVLDNPYYIPYISGGGAFIPLSTGETAVGWLNNSPFGGVSRVQVYNGPMSDIMADSAFSAITTFLAPSTYRLYSNTTSTQLVSGPALAPSGSTARWDQSTTVNFTPDFSGSTTQVAGQTGATLTYTFPDQVIHYFARSIVSSGGSVLATSNYCSAFANDKAPSHLILIGDSITFYQSTVVHDALGAISGSRDVTGGGNWGYSGSTASQWNGGGGYYSQYRTTMLATVSNPAQTDVMLMFGANEGRTGVSATQYRSDLSTLITAILADGYRRVIVDYPSYVSPYNRDQEGYDTTSNGWGNASVALMNSYHAQIDSLINGTTIVAGNKSLSKYPSEHLKLSVDGIHPTNSGNPNSATYASGSQGIVVYGASRAKALADVIDGTGLMVAATSSYEFAS